MLSIVVSSMEKREGKVGRNMCLFVCVTQIEFVCELFIARESIQATVCETSK